LEDLLWAVISSYLKASGVACGVRDLVTGVVCQPHCAIVDKGALELNVCNPVTSTENPNSPLPIVL